MYAVFSVSPKLCPVSPNASLVLLATNSCVVILLSLPACAGSLHVSKPTWWLTSRFHFSFANYFNPSNMNFGALRVLNDDLVKGHAGFG